MLQYDLFLPCAAGVEDYLAAEVQRILGRGAAAVRTHRAGVALRADWDAVLRLNLHSRMANRVLVQLVHAPYRDERDLYNLANAQPWEAWFGPQQTIKVDVSAHACPLKSLHYAALTLKDAVCDRFRSRCDGLRPSVDTHAPDVRLYAHLDEASLSLAIDTSGEALFKRGWRAQTGDAPLKETLAAALLAACGWSEAVAAGQVLPLYDPCCGSGTLVIEAAQIACGIAPGRLRRFAFERLQPTDAKRWGAIKSEALHAHPTGVWAEKPLIFGSDVAHRMVDFAQHNAERAGVAAALQLRGGDALQRLPPLDVADWGGGVLLLNPPYGERIAVAGVAGVPAAQNAADRARLRLPPDLQGASGVGASGARQAPELSSEGDFFERLAAHWKRHYAGWTAWLLSPDRQLSARMRLKPSRRVPLWNGPIECRLMRFDLVAGRHDARAAAPGPAHAAPAPAPAPAPAAKASPQV